MDVGGFIPFPVYEGARARGCFTCTHHKGRFMGEHMVCEQRGVYVIGRPLDGCAYWRREPGSDDE